MWIVGKSGDLKDAVQCTGRSSRAHRTLTHRRWNQFLGESESHGAAVALVDLVELVGES